MSELSRARYAELKTPMLALCFTDDEFMSQRNIDSLHGFYANRSGDVVLIPDPYSYLGEGVLATHGSPYSYDTHVPLIIVASGLIPGHYYDAASPADIAPTVSLLLKTTPPSSAVGRVLTEALRK